MSFQLITVPVSLAQTEDKGTGNEFRANPDAKGKESSAKQMAAMLIGVYGSSVVTSCNFQIFPSAAIFSAGAVAYLLSEMTAGKEHADFLKKKTEDLAFVEEKLKKSDGGGELQREALESALAHEKEVLAFVKKRGKAIGTISLIFKVAVAAAAIEFIIPTPLTPLAKVPMLCPAIGLSGAAIAAGVGGAFAYAGGGGMGGGFKAAIISGALASVPINASANTLTAMRIGFYLATAVVFESLKKDFSGKEQDAQKRIDQLELALAEFNKSTTPTNGVAVDTTRATENGEASVGGVLGSSVATTASRNTAINALPTTTSRNPSKLCAAQVEQNVDFSEKSCLTPLKLPTASFKGNVQIPEMLEASQTVAEYTNSLSRGDLATADIQAAKLNTQAARIDRLKNDLLNQANTSLRLQGNKPIDFEASTKDQLLAMSGSLKASNPDASRLLASLGNNSAVLSDDLKGDGDLKENIQEISASVQSDTVNPSAGTPSTVPESASTYAEPGVASAVTTPATTENKEKSITEGLAEFESSQSDISKKTDVSLFKQVSDRYILNYPTLVRRKSLDSEEQKTK